MTITVTRPDYIGASYGDIRDCPIARALDRAFPTAAIVVGGDTFWINGKQYSLPKEALDGIRPFSTDSTQHNPFSFEMPVAVSIHV